MPHLALENGDLPIFDELSGAGDELQNPEGEFEERSPEGALDSLGENRAKLLAGFKGPLRPWLTKERTPGTFGTFLPKKGISETFETIHPKKRRFETFGMLHPNRLTRLSVATDNRIVPLIGEVPNSQEGSSNEGTA
eukprot:Blabericola_migrator_1__232@NODE_1061_length_5558_cov_570_766891_g729_i0_p5_GENE_NODE_1061_length_5558_cov_570_766891_g729_i0NODE_1061_length_5558_cov_570_766891_g729_i0_p5_ORF_typecomplete_len137_score10_79_NODE_1061_length_5558_cov_570_766891_g729_i0367777